MSQDLTQRLDVFLRAGRLVRVPTPFQVFQGELEMLPWILSSDVTDESRYGGLLSHPVLRQPVILAHIGTDHLKPGSGLPSSLASTITHLHMTFHQGMPVWDLQLVQTFPGGLDTLREQTEAVLAASTPSARRVRRSLRHILPNAERYHRRFLGPDGWIARAERFDYETTAEIGTAMPQHFFDLIDFLRHVEANFPAHPRDLAPYELLRHLSELPTRRFREGRGLAWLPGSQSYADLVARHAG